MDVAVQVRSLTEKEFNAVVDSAFQASATKSRREITNSVKFEDGILVESHKLVDDYLQPDRRHWKLDSMFGEERVFSEWITIGPDKYTRSSGNDWARTDLTGEYDGSRDAASTYAYVGTNAKYYSRKSFLKGRSVRILTRVDSTPPNKVHVAYTYVVYIDMSGLIVKRVDKSVSVNSRTTDSTVYEYRPRNLKNRGSDQVGMRECRTGGVDTVERAEYREDCVE